METETCTCGHVEREELKKKGKKKFDVGPEYYQRRDQEKILPCCYKNFPNRNVWKPFLPKLPRLIGVTKRDFACYFSDGDPMHTYFERLKAYREAEEQYCRNITNMVERTCCDSEKMKKGEKRLSNRTSVKLLKGKRKKAFVWHLTEEDDSKKLIKLDPDDSVRFHRVIDTGPCCSNKCRLNPKHITESTCNLMLEAYKICDNIIDKEIS